MLIQAIGSLLAAMIVYSVAVFAGVVPNGPLTALLTGMTVLSAVALLMIMPRVIANWREVARCLDARPQRTADITEDVRRLYNSLITRVAAVGLFVGYLVMSACSGHP